MRHILTRLPSDVLSGDIRSTNPSATSFPRSVIPTLSLNSLSKKLTSSHGMPEPDGLTQYWSERLSPCDPRSSDLASGSPALSKSLLSPERDSGMERRAHQRPRLSTSPLPSLSVPMGMWSRECTSLSLNMSPSTSLMSTSATWTSLCISSNPICAMGMPFRQYIAERLGRYQA